MTAEDKTQWGETLHRFFDKGNAAGAKAKAKAKASAVKPIARWLA